MKSFRKLFIFVIVSALSLPTFVFAASPSGNYTASDYLTPPGATTAAPGDMTGMASDASFFKKGSEGTALPGGYLKMSGHYRLAAGANGVGGDYILNDSDANQNMNYLQGPNFRYLFGERLYDTYDPAIYSQHRLNLEFTPANKVSFFTQIVNDPWSYVGTTGEQVQKTEPDDSEHIRYNLKYFGANNSTIGEIYRVTDSDRYSIPKIKIHDGHTVTTRVSGLLLPQNTITIPELDIDYEYRPIRKLWMDYTEEQWHVRAFALADETQALTTDDPLGLSNHKDYWQQSPWLDQYRPAQFFDDLTLRHVMKRGYYSDSLSFTARDSEGNRLVLLRGLSFDGHFDKTQVEATVAAPFTPWDEHYFDADNIPGALRVKQQMTENWMLGGTYTFRKGMVDGKTADFGNVLGIDTAYQLRDNTLLKAEVATSQRAKDVSMDQFYDTQTHGNAYKLSVETGYDHAMEGHADFQLSYAQMGRHFDPLLSKYLSTRDDKFWGTHLSFEDRPNLEPFRIGDGLDVNRSVARIQWKEKLFKDQFYNLFDLRNVHKTSNTAYLETVLRNETTYQFNSKLTGKALFRWRGLPQTTQNVEPAMTAFYFPMTDIDPTDFVIQNTAVKGDKDADQFTYSLGLQYAINSQWTVEGIGERTNAIPDFPRGLLNNVFRDANERVDNILLDRMTVFLYGQSELKSAPPYAYYNIFKERLIDQVSDNLKLVLHATQNSYRFAGGIDDNITHIGLSADFAYSKKLSFFADYTFSHQVDIPHFIASNYTQEHYDGHHNIYMSGDYKINASTVFRAEYGVFGLGNNTVLDNPYSTSGFSLPTLDTEHLLRLYLIGDF